MKLAVTGSRRWPKYAKKQIFTVLDSFLPKEHEIWSQSYDLDLLAVGDASGADAYAREWAFNSLADGKTAIFLADWDQYGKKAGPMRNREMLDTVKPDILLAFFIPGEVNSGTWDCVEYAVSCNIRVIPHRLH